MVVDARSGEVLWSQNADTRLHPASLTKMMTLYIAFQELESGRISLDSTVTVSKHAAAQPPSRLGLKAGQKIKLRYLIRAAAIKSANDAAAAIGDFISGDEATFARRMTRTAKALGMSNTTFKNAHGLTVAGHLSSARDMTTLGRHLFYDFPQYYSLFSRLTEDAGIAKVTNTNSRFLQSYEGADGIKTGYTVAAGFNLTASAKRGNKRVIATVFGGSSTAWRNSKMTELLNIGFGNAKSNVRERKPAPAPLDNSAPLVAAAPAQDNAAPAAGKTIRLSGAVNSSLRPKTRPAQADAPVQMAAAAPPAPPPVVVPDAVAAAIAEGVAGALAEATQPPPPPNSFEAQALALNEAPTPSADEAQAAPTQVIASLRPAEAQRPETSGPAPAPNSLEAQAAELAATPQIAAIDAPQGTLEAQAAALAAGAPPASETAEQGNAMLAAVSLRPMARPARESEAETALALAAVEAPEPVIERVRAAAPDPVVELALVNAPPARSSASAETLSEVALRSDAGGESFLQTAASGGAEPATGGRRAPIFDTVEMAQAPSQPEAGAAPVVVSKSTSGGRHWSVSVGAYTSRLEAERALTKTGLAEGATLDQGTRKITESGGKYRATFLGLSENQADLACRRLRARGIACETKSPS